MRYSVTTTTAAAAAGGGSAALGGPWPQTNVARDLYPGHPPANFYNPVSLRLPQYSVRLSLTL